MSSSRLITQLKVMLLGENVADMLAWVHCFTSATVMQTKMSENDSYDIANIKFASTEHEYKFFCFIANNTPKFAHLINNHMSRQYHAYIIFYNLANEASFKKIDDYVSRLNQHVVSQNVKYLLIGIQADGQCKVSEDDSVRKANQHKLELFYGVNPKIEMDIMRLRRPFNYIIEHSPQVINKVNLPDFKFCNEEIDRALRYYCWDQERAQNLKDFKRMLRDFGCFGAEVTKAVLRQMQDECQGIVKAAHGILDGAFSERVKSAVFAAASIVLLTTAVVCGLALLNIVTLPVLTGVLIAGCVLGGAGGLLSTGCALFKFKENNIYSSIVNTAEDAVKDFPGVKLNRQE